MEEKVGGKGFLDQILIPEKIDPIIEQIKKEIPPTVSNEFILKVASSFFLSTDEKFLEELSKRCHKTALFILELEMEKDENTAGDGCYETGRKFISPTNIKRVIIPGNYERENFDSAVNKFFVDSILEQFIFCYKDEGEKIHQIDIGKKILIPNYEGALRKFTKDRELAVKPFYTHMTRLF
jgi:hypothetical protein